MSFRGKVRRDVLQIPKVAKSYFRKAAVALGFRGYPGVSVVKSLANHRVILL